MHRVLPYTTDNLMMESGSPPAYVYTQQPQVVVQQQQVFGNPPGDQLIMSIFTTFCCFMPLGIIALIKSMEVSVQSYYAPINCMPHLPPPGTGWGLGGGIDLINDPDGWGC